MNSFNISDVVLVGIITASAAIIPSIIMQVAGIINGWRQRKHELRLKKMELYEAKKLEAIHEYIDSLTKLTNITPDVPQAIRERWTIAGVQLVVYLSKENRRKVEDYNYELSSLLSDDAFLKGHVDYRKLRTLYDLCISALHEEITKI